MPVIIPQDLPAAAILAVECSKAVSELRADHQVTRPLRVAILNLMPTKEATETQLLRLLNHSHLLVEVVLVRMASYQSKNTAREHLDRFYLTFDQIESQYFDGLIITGAPVETLPFEQVDYWPELTRILDWSRDHSRSTFHICWGAQAALYHHYGIQKYDLPEKCFGVFPHRPRVSDCFLLRGFDDEFFIPHSRHTTLRKGELEAVPGLTILAESDQAGVSLLIAQDGRQVFATGHSEYDPLTLAAEYHRDQKRGLSIAVPVNYFPDDDPAQTPLVRWRSHAYLLFSNWLNYYVWNKEESLAPRPSPLVG